MAGEGGWAALLSTAGHGGWPSSKSRASLSNRPCCAPALHPLLASPTGQNLLLALNYVHPGEERLVCEAHEQWGTAFQSLHPQLPPLTAADVDCSEGRPLVVRWAVRAFGLWVC